MSTLGPALVRRWRIAAVVGVLGASGFLAVWKWADRVSPVPQRPLRIGFGENPPMQVRTKNGYSGLSVDIANEAARRAGITLQWVETGIFLALALALAGTCIWWLVRRVG